MVDIRLSPGLAKDVCGILDDGDGRVSLSGTKDHHLRMSSVICLPGRTGAVVSGQGAPMRTQSERTWISSAVSLAPLGGILRSVVWWTADQQEALFGIAGNDGGAGFAALEDGRRESRGRGRLWRAVLVAAAAGVGEDAGAPCSRSTLRRASLWPAAAVSRATTGWRGVGAIPGGAARTHSTRLAMSPSASLAPLGRHLEVAGLLDGLDEEALVGIAGDRRRGRRRRP